MKHSSVRCIDCIFSEESQKKLKCEKGLFDVKIIDGILLLPLDYDCIDFEPKEKKMKIEKEVIEETKEIKKIKKGNTVNVPLKTSLLSEQVAEEIVTKFGIKQPKLKLRYKSRVISKK